MSKFRKQIIQHILHMKQFDQDYAREALKRYHAELPWLDLIDGIREALK